MLNLQEKYKEIAVPEMIKKFNYNNKMAIPKIEKVVINIGFGKDSISKSGDELKKFMAGIEENLIQITGQKPSLRKAKKSISGFKLREGSIIGSKVTLRGKRMNHFIDKFVNIALPRSRDFRGIDLKGFDREGNLTIGIKEHIIFPEVLADKIRNIFGFQITIKTTAKTKEEGIELLRLLGFPLKKI